MYAEHLGQCPSEYKLVQPLWKMWKFLKKPKIELLYDPAIPFLGMHSDKAIIQKDTCTLMFTIYIVNKILALFTKAKTCKQSKCPLTDEWIKKMWYIYIQMEYSSNIKKE